MEDNKMEHTIKNIIDRFKDNPEMKRMDIRIDEYNVKIYCVGKNIRIDIDIED
jgi:hypothetical protein